MHDPGRWARSSIAALFVDPVLLGAYEALLGSDTHAAMASAQPAVADLLARCWSTSRRPSRSTRGLLHIEVARREIAAVRLAAATAADGTQALIDVATLGHVIDGLRERKPAPESAGQIASLARGSGRSRGVEHVPSALDAWNGSAEDELPLAVEQPVRPGA